MLSLNVNGKSYAVDVDPTTPLLWVLRDVIGLTGTKFGCGIEVCGACTVWVDGEPEKACHIEVKEVVGRRVTTIEGLSADRSHPVQQAWIQAQVPQCGYCQSGMIMKVAAMLAGGNRPSNAEIDAELNNICACGTYPRIRIAIHAAVARMASR